MQPEAGGLYVYIRDAFGPLLAFLYGWASFLVIASGSVATLGRGVRDATSGRSSRSTPTAARRLGRS